MFKRLRNVSARIALAACVSILLASTASAGGALFPNYNSFVFSGNSSAGPVWGQQTPPIYQNLKICPLNSYFCSYGYGQDIGNGSLLAENFDQMDNGAALRGTQINNRTYHSMQFELHTKDFFSKNPGAHIAVAPRAHLPYVENGSMHGGYAPMPVYQASQPAVKVPYAMGSGVILGSVPCQNVDAGDTDPSASVYRRRPFNHAGFVDVGGNTSNGVAIEHFLRSPSAGSGNRTWCYRQSTSPTPVFADNTIYRVTATVKRGACVDGSGTCQWTGYLIERKDCSSGPCTYVAVTSGGGPNKFADVSANPGYPYPPAGGWSMVQAGDQPDWYIAHVFTTKFNTIDANTNWSFEVRDLVVEATDTAPVYWNACLDNFYPSTAMCGSP